MGSDSTLYPAFKSFESKNIHNYPKKAIKILFFFLIHICMRPDFLYFNQNNIFQQIECRNRYENSVIFIKPDMKEIYKNVKYCQ